MPELPEVERSRRFLETHLRGRRIVDVTVAHDPIVFERTSPRRLRDALRGRTVRSIERRGKHLWLVLDRAPHPVFHFGMGGDFHRYEESMPRFWKLALRTDRGTRLAMTNPRRLGRVRLRRDPRAEPPISLLGFDPLADDLSVAVLGPLLARRHAPLKAVLLDQSVFAGVGNWIADEVLYQARLDPHRAPADLAPRETERLLRVLTRVVRRAVDVDAESGRFPRTWLFHDRWGKRPEARTARGERIVFTTLGGRTTAWVPGVQR